MSISLLEAVQLNLGYPPLSKIDSNNNLVVPADYHADANSFSQAAIPAVLAALHRYAQTDEGAENVLKHGATNNWTKRIFKENSYAAIQAIANYAELSAEDAVEHMNIIAAEAMRIVKENIPAAAGINEVKLFFSAQINQILLYLPPNLQIGALLHDDTLDDNTHKMEGPISSLMNSIGGAFSSPVTTEETKMI